jgi:ClpA/ClpB-like protein
MRRDDWWRGSGANRGTRRCRSERVDYRTGGARCSNGSPTGPGSCCARPRRGICREGGCGTEHLLLGLLDEGDELVAEALKGAGFPERAARLSRAYPPTVRTVHIPFAREAVGALHRSQEESAALGEAQVRPGHLLLALLRGDDASSPRGGGAIKMLQEQGWTWYRCGTE